MAWIMIVLVLIAFDQVSKYVVVQNVGYREVIPVISDFFYITFLKNKGAAWGILQNYKIFLIVTTIIALGLLIYLLIKSENNLSRYAIVIIIGGAMGNFIDRAFKEGGVVDFLLFRFGTYEFPTFNVADMLIVCGTALLVVSTLLESKNEGKNENKISSNVAKVEESEKCN